MNWQVGVEEFARESRMLADLCESAGRGPASIRWTHAPNFQLFDSEREFARWQQDKRLGLSAEDVYAYIRSRGAVCMARLRPSRWTAPGILEALIPGRMQSHACTAEVPR